MYERVCEYSQAVRPHTGVVELEEAFAGDSTTAKDLEFALEVVAGGLALLSLPGDTRDILFGHLHDR